jgi:SNF2 family DNA or RNA helicase
MPRRLMPASMKLKQRPERLAVAIGGLRGDEFRSALAAIKDIPGRRFNPETKDWELPADPAMALKVTHTLAVALDAGARELLRRASEEAVESIASPIADDAALALPWRDRLYPYQRAFVQFAQDHPRTLLGDDMGVGKTVQSIAAVEEFMIHNPEHADKPRLCVVPNGLRLNWKLQLNQWLEHPRVAVIAGANHGKRRLELEAAYRSAQTWVVINWEKLRSDTDLLESVEWGAIIADEAHRAKNRKAKQTKGLWKLRAPTMIAASGTFVRNSPDELWPLLKWLRPEQYTAFWAFHNSYVDDYYAPQRGRQMRGVKNMDKLRFELADKLVRRTKAQVLPDLPEKLPPQEVPVELPKGERDLYKEAETALFLDIRAHVAEQTDSREEAEALLDELSDLPLERLQRLIPHGAARITALRQITAVVKAREAVELAEDAGEPLVVFTWYVEPARQIRDALEKRGHRVALIAGDADGSTLAKAFQDGEYDHVVCTIAKAEGFDLFRASTAIFADRDWVPASNQQAIDRLHRQGQKSAVSTVILQVPGTVDTGRVAPANKFKAGIVRELFGE